MEEKAHNSCCLFHSWGHTSTQSFRNRPHENGAAMYGEMIETLWSEFGLGSIRERL